MHVFVYSLYCSGILTVLYVGLLAFYTTMYVFVMYVHRIGITETTPTTTTYMQPMYYSLLTSFSKLNP